MKCDHCAAITGDEGGFSPAMGGLTDNQNKVAEFMAKNEEDFICEDCYFEYLKDEEIKNGERIQSNHTNTPAN